MTLDDAIHFFESEISKSTKKAEISVYTQFLHVLNGLKNRDFSETELQSIGIELDILQLTSGPKRPVKFFKNALHAFESHLKETYALVSKKYYTSLGMTWGPMIGLFIGMLVFSDLERSMGVVIGVTGGMVLGLMLGGVMDRAVWNEGRTL